MSHKTCQQPAHGENVKLKEKKKEMVMKRQEPQSYIWRKRERMEHGAWLRRRDCKEDRREWVGTFHGGRRYHQDPGSREKAVSVR